MLHSADGTCRDWRGLAEKAGFTTNEIKDFEYREAVDVQILEYRYVYFTATAQCITDIRSTVAFYSIHKMRRSKILNVRGKTGLVRRSS